MNAADPAEPVDALLAAAYALDGPEANRALYARWAATYEAGFIAESRYIYHAQVVEVFAARALGRLEAGDAVVDVGCGTGLAGEALQRHGVVTVDGIDISPEMLRQASTKQFRGHAVYRQLIEADLTRPLAVETHTYAGAVSAGTFTHGHVGPDALSEFVRIVRSGGCAAIGVNAAHFAAAPFGDVLEELQRAGRIAALELTDVPIYEGADLGDTDQFAHVAVFAVL
jgi:SAM-dependent methyltransferase